jgi:hypothetical protein
MLMPSLLYSVFHEPEKLDARELGLANISELCEISGGVEVADAGELNLASGQIVANDPYLYEGDLPIVGRVYPDKYPVKLCQVCVKSEYEGEVYTQLLTCAAMIEIKPEEPVKWVLAYQPDVWMDDYGPGMKGKSFLKAGFACDSATGCFMDYETAKLHVQYDKELLEKGHRAGIQDILGQKLGEAQAAAWFSYYPCPDTNQELNEVCFFTGSDGVFGSYWGLKSNSEIVCLVTDFAGLAGRE